MVTGGSGFIATACIAQLLKAGYGVRTTIRSAARKNDVLSQVLKAGAEASNNISFFLTDLNADNGWAEAIAGCDYVLHVASPFPSRIPKYEDELIVPARDGTLRVLKAARDAGISRVVVTSSFAAVGYGQSAVSDPFTENDWTDLSNKHISAYVRSKTMAEKAAWDFIKREGGGLELSVVNPVAVFGPLYGPRLPASAETLRRFINGSWKACPRIFFNAVNVRDVADLHLRVMIHPEAKGHRFLASSGNCLHIQEVAMLLKNNLGKYAKHIPTRLMPDWLVKLGSLFIPALKHLVPELGRIKNVSNEKAIKLLNWSVRKPEEAIFETANSLVERLRS